MNAPHQNQPVATAGTPLDAASAAMILLHGRGATAESILMLAEELDHPELAYLAPQAAGLSWYPGRFIAPLEANEPDRSSALAVVDGLVDRLNDHGIPPSRVLLLGFSQGACLTAEYALRHPRRWGGLAILTGGFQGPLAPVGAGPARPELPGEGDFAGTPVFLGTSDPDPHVPVERVRETAQRFRQAGAAVDLRIYPGLGHTVNQEEIEAVRGQIVALGDPGDSLAEPSAGS